MAPTIIKVNNFRFRSKIAAFDYDHTLVQPKSNSKFTSNIDDWKWLQLTIPEIIKSYYNKGYSIIVFTNQTKEWKKTQIENVMKTLDIPCLVAIAMDKIDHKPSTNMFNAVIGTKKWNKEASFFVGDAMGRKDDWSNTDKLFAENIGIIAKTPEEIFPYIPIISPIISPNISIEDVATQEIIIMVGYPGSGKTSVIKDKFNENDQYTILSGDILKTSAKMIKNAKTFLEDGKSVIFDATNPTIAKRAEYLNLGKTYKIPTRCIYVSTSFDESFNRNSQRPEDQRIPKIAYYVYRKKFEIPKETEGFSLITI